MPRWPLTFLLFAAPLFLLAREEYPSPARSVERIQLPEGFRAQLVAGEPTLVKPIAMTTDERGRVWVVESHSYPHWITDGRPGKDRVLILEPDDRGGYSSKVFLDNGTNLSGIAVGFGGVWLASVPSILYLPMKDDRPSGPAVVHLDGFSLKTKHNVVNSLCWGPDGWLYGLNGIQSQSRLGAPGTPDVRRLGIDCGVWRYHPTRKKVEAVAHGTTNPWGMDWDEHGEIFITNCVIKHIFHVVPGGHFVRMYGQDLEPHCYSLIESCADHIHWGGGNWTTSRGGKPEHSAAGGGHAHAGAMFYLGDNWPATYRNRIFMGNIHGSRLNQDRLEPSGSGYAARHCEDFLLANDPWFRPLWLAMAHDGAAYVGDWHDTGECHNYDKTHPSGRIYRVTFGSPAPTRIDLARDSDAALVRRQLHRNDWHVRQARRLLQERAHQGNLSAEVAPALVRMLDEEKASPARLRALWALHAIGATSDKLLTRLLDDADPFLRLWSVRLLGDHGSPAKPIVERLTRLAGEEKSAPVRLALASALQRIEPAARWELAGKLAARAEDAGDAYLPLMIWYGVIPSVGSDPGRAIDLLRSARIPLVGRHIARRLTQEEKPARLAALATLLRTGDDGVRRIVLEGMGEALLGRRSVPAPAEWAKVHEALQASKDDEVRERGLVLSVLFGNEQALKTLMHIAEDGKADPAARARALQVLLDKRAEGVHALLGRLLDDTGLRGQALRGLANYNDPKTPESILARYAKLSPSEKADAVSTLASRPAYALALLDAIEKKQVARADVTPFTARQLAALGDKRVRDRLASVWGTIRPPSKDKESLLKRYRALATSGALESASASAGRQVWTKTCANCHTLFGEGSKIGPDLTGSQRTNPDYILTKVIDPGVAVPRDYQLVKIVTLGGRVLTGIVKQENDKVILLQTATEEVRVLKSDVETRELQPGSLMPDGMLATLTDAQVRDLLAYLASPKQVR